MIPKVSFDINKELDIQMTYSFLGWSIAGVSFDESIFGTNPDLRNYDTKDISEITRYFDEAYKKHSEKLTDSVKIAKSLWEGIESSFISKVVDLFKGHQFPDGKYICYLSLTDCNPRFLEDKTFQMYYKALTPTRTISHELTHFLFYDYTKAKHAKIFGELDPNNGVYWSLAELFNNVVLSSDDFVQLLDNYGDGAYPEHVKYYQPMKSIWEENKDVDLFILNAFRYLEERLKF